jgi:hypothetical protein
MNIHRPSHWVNVALAVALLASTGVLQAGSDKGGNGKGRTKIDFKAKTDDPTTTRLFAKLDVAAGVALLPAVGAKSLNDEIAGQTITLTVGSATFTGVADEKGKFKTPFDCKLTANGSILQIKYTGLDLVALFPLNTADGEYTVSVPLKVTASKAQVDPNGQPVIDPATGQQAVTTVTLSEQTVAFSYTTKKGQIKGKNF